MENVINWTYNVLWIVWKFNFQFKTFISLFSKIGLKQELPDKFLIAAKQQSSGEYLKKKEALMDFFNQPKSCSKHIICLSNTYKIAKKKKQIYASISSQYTNVICSFY